MSMDRCSSCERFVDTDEEPDSYVGDRCICGRCQEVAGEATCYAELERSYNQDRS